MQPVKINYEMILKGLEIMKIIDNHYEEKRNRLQYLEAEIQNHSGLCDCMYCKEYEKNNMDVETDNDNFIIRRNRGIKEDAYVMFCFNLSKDLSEFDDEQYRCFMKFKPMWSIKQNMWCIIHCTEYSFDDVDFNINTIIECIKNEDTFECFPFLPCAKLVTNVLKEEDKKYCLDKLKSLLYDFRACKIEIIRKQLDTGDLITFRDRHYYD
jgi:hypothetical protein